MKKPPTEKIPPKGSKPVLDIHPGMPFEPSYVYKMLQVMKYDTAFKVRYLPLM